MGLPVIDRKNFFRAARLALAGAAVLLLCESPGCGGVVLDSGSPRDGEDAGTTGSSSGHGSGGSSSIGADASVFNPGTGGKPVKSRCGNGKREGAEQCDGADFGGGTCMTTTMGMHPVGSITCTAACAVDTTRCRSAGTGTGGTTGGGGTGGFGGASNACYEANGVPTQGTGTGGTSNGCAYGYVADTLCLGRTAPPTPTGGCAQSCACNACPGSYTRCMTDGVCGGLLACALTSGCSSAAECYKLGCGAAIDRAGGLGSQTTRYFGSALDCFWQSGCGYPCAVTSPPPPAPPATAVPSPAPPVPNSR